VEGGGDGEVLGYSQEQKYVSHLLKPETYMVFHSNVALL